MGMLPIVAGAFLLCLASAAQGEERRIFVVNNFTDSHAHRCIVFSQGCGLTAANVYCQKQQFKESVAFRMADRSDFTGSVSTDVGSCRGPNCDEAMAVIVCAR